MKTVKNSLIALTVFFVACAGNKRNNSEVTYLDTDGLSLLYEMTNGTNGLLVVNSIDTIPFTYKVSKSNEKIIDSKTLKSKNTSIYLYHIEYSQNYSRYSVLEKFKVLPSLRRKTIFRYESHVK